MARSMKWPFMTAVALSSAMASASGILLQEAVVANAGTTGAGDGVYTGSAAAMWTNPATMSFMGESKTTVNAMGFDLKLNYEDQRNFLIGDRQNNGTSQSTQPSVGLFHTQQITDDMHFGIGFGAAGGSSLDYGDWAAKAYLESTTLMMLQINPTISYQLNDQWSLGAGAQINYVTFEQTTSLMSIDQETDWAMGITLGAMYRHSDAFDFGFSYRSKVEHKLDAKANSDMLTGLVGASTEVAMPAIYDLSARWGATSELNLLASAQWHRWSEWKELPLDLIFADSVQGGSIERDWSDVWKLTLGADYRLNADWRLKAGISYESSPQNDASLQWVDVPVGEQWRYSVGAATEWNGYTFDMFYEYADLGEVEIDRNPTLTPRIKGTFDGRIHFIGLNVTF
ncbi:OmpP1/FadL family transporter [Vibrio scophthalmi]|uniref:OmpP1/FadL family transporter n=1 Tax=Vibrio scophthalmi TaxID=45658 RepID=UPI003B51BABC